MARKAKRRSFNMRSNKVLIAGLCVLVVASAVTYQVLFGNKMKVTYGEPIDPNIGIRTLVEEFFTANGAEEMIPIVQCESRFRHYNADGSLLHNRAGSSAVGVTQILSSVHPDPKVLSSYNRNHNTELTPDDFDITTLEGNLGYALVLYEVRGTRDWECSKKFRWRS